MRKIWKPLLALACAAALCGCSTAEEESYHIDLSDPAEGIFTAADLIDFIENGEGDTVTLGGSVDLSGAMLKLTRARGSVTINGAGNCITSGGDCVIRLENGCTLRMNDLSINAGADAIGCLGDASIGGQGIRIEALTNAIHSAGGVTVLAGSEMQLNAAHGSGVIAKAFTLEAGAQVQAAGEQGAVHVSKNDLTLLRGARLSAQTAAYYNALKCAGELRMEDGAELDVQNLGDYHGAELGGIAVSGAATIRADGGDKGVGIFLFDLQEDVTVVGHCSPSPRFESGGGSITFVSSADAVPVRSAAPEETEEE